MHWIKTTDLNTKALHRIVALLFALADLADLASSRSRPVRCAVLWLLRSAEVIASDYTAEITRDPRLAGQSAPATIGLAGDNPSEATRLAKRFRALAAALCALADEVFASPQLDIACARLAHLAKCVAGMPCARPGRIWSPERLDSS